jgi:hypothetical protein
MMPSKAKNQAKFYPLALGLRVTQPINHLCFALRKLMIDVDAPSSMPKKTDF